MDQTLTRSEHWFPHVDVSNASGMATQPNVNFPDLTELRCILLTPPPPLKFPASWAYGLCCLLALLLPLCLLLHLPRAPLTLFHSCHSPSCTLCAMASPRLYSQSQPLTAPKQRSLWNGNANDHGMLARDLVPTYTYLDWHFC